MDRIEQKIIDIIDANRHRIIEFGRDVFCNGELGYKEFKTSKKFYEFCKELNLEMQEEIAITGVKAHLRGRKRNITLALIGELDAISIPDYVDANKETGAAHCCGHHAQLAGVIGAALALSNTEVRDELDGDIVFFAVPAEEYGEIEFKNKLKEEGIIRYGGGKSELIRIGAFDEIDLSIVHHSGFEGITIGSNTTNGFVSKVIRLLGKEAHSAASPEDGINALNAASIGMTALAYQRETFRDEDSVRIQPIITKGGNLVNVVPGEVSIETVVRAKNTEAMLDADEKTERAFIGGAYAVGAGIEITTMPGYLPMLFEPAHPLVLEAAKEAAPNKLVTEVDPNNHIAYSTDVGDLQHIMPVLEFHTSGVVGGLHSKNFKVVDEEEAYIITAKIFALSAYKLLKDEANAAIEYSKKYQPKYTKDEYLEYMDSFIRIDLNPSLNAYNKK